MARVRLALEGSGAGKQCAAGVRSSRDWCRWVLAARGYYGWPDDSVHKKGQLSTERPRIRTGSCPIWSGGGSGSTPIKGVTNLANLAAEVRVYVDKRSDLRVCPKNR